MKKLIPVFLLLCSFPCFIQLKAQVDSVSGYYTSFDGARIYYEVKGKGAAVILLHGFTNTGENWKRAALFGDLLSQGYKVITLDMRGNGKSDKPHEPASYAKDAEAKDIMGLLSMLGIKKYSAVGYSRGSIITARLLVLDKRVDKAVMGGMGTDFTNPEWPRRKMFYQALSGDTTIKELQAMVKSVQDRGLDQQAQALLQKEQPSTSLAVLGKVKQPVLVVCGDQDEDNGKADELAKVFPHGIFVSVPGVHNTASRTKEFSSAVLSFLKK